MMVKYPSNKAFFSSMGLRYTIINHADIIDIFRALVVKKLGLQTLSNTFLAWLPWQRPFPCAGAELQGSSPISLDEAVPFEPLLPSVLSGAGSGLSLLGSGAG